jgi:uncharacterized protein (DUF433 family)
MQIAEYVQEREGEYFVNATRVTLRSVIADWKRGRTPEQIVEDFPSVQLVAIYGAITTYLERQLEFDQRFAEADARAADEKAKTEAAHAAFYAELRQHSILPDDPKGSDGADITPARDDS